MKRAADKNAGAEWVLVLAFFLRRQAIGSALPQDSDSTRSVEMNLAGLFKAGTMPSSIFALP